NSEDGVSALGDHQDKVLRGLNQLFTRARRPSVEKIAEHIDNDQHRPFHAKDHQKRQGRRPAAAYLPRLPSAPSRSRSGSRSPSLASWMMAFASAVDPGPLRSVGASLASAASNAAVKLAMSSGPNEWSFSRIVPIGTSSPAIARRPPRRA